LNWKLAKFRGENNNSRADGIGPTDGERSNKGESKKSF